MPHAGKVESLLFVATRPLSEKKIAALLSLSLEDTAAALTELEARYAEQERGISLVHHEDQVQLVSNPQYGEFIAEYLQEEAKSELSRPALETLAVIAYRGPVTKAEIEHIRGVQSWQSLRNLLMRGLIDEKPGDSQDESSYCISVDLLNHLGIQSVSSLPDFASLHTLALDQREVQA